MTCRGVLDTISQLLDGEFHVVAAVRRLNPDLVLLDISHRPSIAAIRPMAQSAAMLTSSHLWFESAGFPGSRL
jgi:hypothetical protein